MGMCPKFLGWGIIKMILLVRKRRVNLGDDWLCRALALSQSTYVDLGPESWLRRLLVHGPQSKVVARLLRRAV